MSILANELKSKYQYNSVILNILLASCICVFFTWAWDEIEYNYFLIAFQRTDCKKRCTAPGKFNMHENIVSYSSWSFHSTIYLWSAIENLPSYPNITSHELKVLHPSTCHLKTVWVSQEFCVISSDGWLRYSRPSQIASGSQVRQLKCSLCDWNSLQATTTTAKQILGLCSGSR